MEGGREDREKITARKLYRKALHKSTEAGNRRPGLLILICIFILWGGEGRREPPISFREKEKEGPSPLLPVRGGERTLFVDVGPSYFQSTLEPFSWMHGRSLWGTTDGAGLALFSHLSQRGPRGQVSDRIATITELYITLPLLQRAYSSSSCLDRFHSSTRCCLNFHLSTCWTCCTLLASFRCSAMFSNSLYSK